MFIEVPSFQIYKLRLIIDITEVCFSTHKLISKCLIHFLILIILLSPIEYICKLIVYFRRLFFIVVYFLFFYNIFLGFISCLLRIIKAIVIGTIFMSRIDHSTLPLKFQDKDPG